ncbi:MAG: thiol:disulfide interchange protein, partial [Flavobacteriales bacterium]|nr:thiol:disulfide interchange protein [Flavobacteriales bacterium]
MKRLLVVLFTLMSVVVSAQIFNPVEWEFSQKQLSDTEIELQFKASIEDHWHLYSQHIEDDGPVPTEFTFTTTDGFELVGNMQEGEPLEEFDPNFDMILKYFGNEAIFTQKVKVISATDFKLDGNVYFMVCDEAQCLPPEEVEFSFDIKGVDGGEAVSDTKGSSDEKEGKSMWALFFIAFFSGFAALLTPCVFPMIPMTVSFFTKQSKTKAKGIANAIIYGLSIIVIYVALGVGVSSIFGADSLNNMATNVYFNIGFFLLLIIFGASF